MLSRKHIDLVVKWKMQWWIIASFLVLITIISFSNFTSAQSATDTTFLRAIQDQGVNTSNLSASNAISRYDTARLMSSVECLDCLNPPQRMRERYTRQWLNDFVVIPSNNFDDLTHPVTRYKSLNYYYCTAYAADQWYINGYPRTSSPYCPGKFCGTANTSMSEFVQIIFNISAKYSSVDYDADWKSILARTVQLSNIAQASIYDLDDLATIKRSAEWCTDTSCDTMTQAQLTAYAKYCTYNLLACNFNTFAGAGEKTWPVAQLNILVKESIIPNSQADAISRVITRLAPRQQMINIFATINNKTQCDFDNDYDGDKVDNTKDNCPYDSNPSQRDTNKWWVGDVCDCDIDNDGKPNGLGAVDDLGKVIYTNLRTTRGCYDDNGDDNTVIDNCLTNYNPWQEDLNNNGIGDACETTNLRGLRVKPDTMCAVAPATVWFGCTYTGAIWPINWSFGDGGKTQGCNVSHRYTTPATYTVQARANSGVNATTTIKVIGSSQQPWLALTTTTPVVSVGQTIKIKPVFRGSIDTIQYVSSLGNMSRTPSQDVIFSTSQAGNYSITAKAYRNNIIIAASQIIVSVSSTTQRNISVILRPDSLTNKVNTPIKFTTTLNGITASAIKSVSWDFGDGSNSVGNDLSISKIYLTSGPKVITQKIILNDNTELITMTTVWVEWSNDQCLSAYLSAVPLIQQVGQPIDFTNHLVNFGVDQLAKISCNYGDGMIKVFDTNLESYLTQAHVYLVAWQYTVQCSLTLNNWLILPTSATVTVVGRDRCWDISKYKCDMDRDKIPDICDEDIDGDGTNNLMWLILYEKPNCAIDSQNTNIPLEQYEHQQAAQGINIDNCPFRVNADQADDNKNWYGNVCDNGWSNGDGGGDTDKTSCILFDGTIYPWPCPVINPTTPSISTIQVKWCSKCPCQYVQAPSDIVRSILLNQQQSFIQVIGTTLSIK